MKKTHPLKHYKIQPDGSLKLVATTWIPDPPRPILNFSCLDWRNIADNARNETDRLAFEALVDRANEWEA